MELFTLQYVLAVAEYRKFSLAAQACYIGQPALSQQIAKLEKELGVTLFVRNAHTVTPRSRERNSSCAPRRSCRA